MARTVNREEKHVTTFSELQEYAKGAIVELPQFADGQPFVARMRRPSLLGLIKNGTIPNTLITKANELFASSDDVLNVDDEQMMSELFDVIDIIAEASFVSPTYEEIKESGIQLTDEQMMFIFNYSQRGVKALEPFRKE